MVSVYMLGAFTAFPRFRSQIIVSVSQCISSYGYLRWQCCGGRDITFWGEVSSQTGAALYPVYIFRNGTRSRQYYLAHSWLMKLLLNWLNSELYRRQGRWSRALCRRHSNSSESSRKTVTDIWEQIIWTDLKGRVNFQTRLSSVCEREYCKKFNIATLFMEMLNLHFYPYSSVYLSSCAYVTIALSYLKINMYRIYVGAAVAQLV
jgi:hypothetical protein